MKKMNQELNLNLKIEKMNEKNQQNQKLKKKVQRNLVLRPVCDIVFDENHTGVTEY
jgi:hypothetical protein